MGKVLYRQIAPFQNRQTRELTNEDICSNLGTNISSNRRFGHLTLIQSMTSKRIFYCIFWLSVGTIALLSCGKEAVQSPDNSGTRPQFGGSLRLAAQPPESLDPIHSKNYWESEIVLQLFESLLKFDSNLNIVPALAQNWQVSNDGMVYTFNLRKTARFHHGRAVTSQDVIYSLTRLLDPKQNSVMRTSIREFVERPISGQAETLRFLDCGLSPTRLCKSPWSSHILLCFERWPSNPLP
jgi:hypothetical protein